MWRLEDVADNGTPNLTFAAYELQPQTTVRVYTNKDHPKSGGFSFQRGSSVWKNSTPDTAGLFNPDSV